MRVLLLANYYFYKLQRQYSQTPLLHFLFVQIKNWTPFIFKSNVARWPWWNSEAILIIVVHFQYRPFSSFTTRGKKNTLEATGIPKIVSLLFCNHHLKSWLQSPAPPMRIKMGQNVLGKIASFLTFSAGRWRIGSFSSILSSPFMAYSFTVATVESTSCDNFCFM